MTSKALREREFTGWHMLAGMGAFFGVIIGVNVFLAVSASRTWTGLVVENSYVASQEFNEKERLAKEQAALGWRAVLTYDASRLQLDIRDRDGAPIDLGPVTVALTRPLGDHEDRTVPLFRGTNGVYSAVIDLPHGVWNAVSAAPGTPHGAFEQHSRLMIR
ncbi:Nitrogen fixation protein FixH [Kaistia soli DSM 19436]|uniref:Nitrogen fixation protein FixH n=1 Tax=Kaistia soli DSM 19436 TaxID=1122133 RepID=A0A1M5E649_9HYPH|nr:FixH family protein [Kaistia soli]SHF74719.1 Nitrogen fixation protein FixH [Kaistia soli DSM 19436]